MSLEISKKQDGSSMEIALAGSLDAMTAPQLETELEHCLDGVTDLGFDFSDLSYISSAGLRMMVYASKKMSGKGRMKIVHVNGILREVFEVTGLTEMLDIE